MLAAWLAILMFSRGAAAQIASPCDDPTGLTVFVAKKIITMDPGWPTATAVAVKDGRIVSVGTLEQLRPWVGDNPRVCTRFQDQVLMPGFVEPHQHPVNGGLMASLPYIGYAPMLNRAGPQRGYDSKDDFLRALDQLSRQIRDPGVPLLAWGYDELPQGEVTRLDVNQIGVAPGQTSTRPIALWSASEHVVYASDAWLKLLGITPDGSNWKVVGPAAVSSALAPVRTSISRELPANAKRVYCIEPETLPKGVEFLTALNQSRGVTTMSDLDFGIFDYATEYAIEYPYFNRPDVPMRLVVVTDALAAAAQNPIDPIAFARGLQARNTDKVVFRGIKFYLDDAFFSLGMQLDFPGYQDPRRYQGKWNSQPGMGLVSAMFPWWKAGFDIHVHSNGDRAQDVLLDALAGLQQALPRVDHRFTFEHFGMSRTDQIRRLQALGGVVSANGYYVYLRGHLNASQLGTDRASLSVRLKSLFDAGVPTAVHSDFPVAETNPLLAVQTAVTRFSLKDRRLLPVPLAPEERITIAQALQTVTTNAAYVHRLEDRVGSIEAGKLADFVVLSADPLAGPVETVSERIRVIATIVGGRVFAAKPPVASSGECRLQ